MLNSAQRINDLPRPSDDAIEAIILQATSSNPDLRPIRDTRTQLFVGNLPYRVRWQDLKDLFRKAGTVLRADVSLGPDNRSRGYGTVLLATAEDAGRAVDMFNGYTWQTRVLEVRLDRLLPDFDSGRLGSGSGLGVATGLAIGHIPAPHISGDVTGSYLGLPIGGAGSGFTALRGASEPEPSFINSVADLTFSQNFAPSRPSSSSTASHVSVDLLRSSASPSFNTEPQSTDHLANRTLFVGNLPFHIQWQDLKDLFRQAGSVIRADVVLGPDNRSRGFGTVVFAAEVDAEKAVKMFNGYEYEGRVIKVHFDKFPNVTSPTPSLPIQPTFFSTSPYAILNPSASPAQQQFYPHTNQSKRDSSVHSSASSTAAHSIASSPLPGHAVSPTLSHHGRAHREGNIGQINLGLNPHYGRPALFQEDGQTTIPPGFFYDYGSPTSTHEFYQRQQEKENFEPVLQQAEWECSKQGGQFRDGNIDRTGYLHQKESDWNRDKDLESGSRMLARHMPATSDVLDIESLTTSLASMRYSPSGRLSHVLESSLSPGSLSVPISVSASGSTSNSNSNPGSKPPSTKPTLGAFTSPLSLASFSTTSLPAHFDAELEGSGLDTTGGTLSVGGSRKASFTSVLGSYDHPYGHTHPYPPSMSTYPSTGSTSASSLLSDFDSTDSVRSPFAEQDFSQVDVTERPSSLMPSEGGNGRLSRGSQAESAGGSRPGSQVGMKEDQSLQQQELASSKQRSLSRQSATHAQDGQIQKQHPHHPGPIALPPLFNPMQIPMMLPLTTMTPGHPHGHARTPHAFPLGGMMNFSPLYHPATIAAASRHDGGSSSPFGMYPGPPVMTGAMMPLTPHGLPPMTPSMPPFTFFPQQYYGSVGVRGSAEDREGGEGGQEEGIGASLDRSSARVQSPTTSQMQPLRLNIGAVHSGFSPGVAMSPGTFFGRPGHAPHPNPYINAAVGAPVHPVGSHPAQSPVQHPAYKGGYVTGMTIAQGGYPYPIHSPVEGGVELKGYFDHVYLPGPTGNIGSEEGGGAGGEKKGGGRKSGKQNEAVVTSPIQEDDVSPLSRDEENVEEEEYAPSRTHSVGHTRSSSTQGRGKFYRSGSDGPVVDVENNGSTSRKLVE